MVKPKEYDGEINLKEILDNLSSTVVSRGDALTDLKQLLIRYKNNPKLADLEGDEEDNKGQNVYNRIIDIVLADKQSYQKAKTSGAQSTWRGKMETSALALRETVEFGSPVLKKVTAKAIIDHIIATLPNVKGEFLAPLCQSYLISLAAILRHKAYVRSLSKLKWESVLQFCVDGILQNYEREPSSSRTPSFMGETLGTSMSSTSVSQAKKSSTSRPLRSINAKDMEQLLTCLFFLLLTPPNAALLLEHSDGILSCVLHFMRSAQSSTISKTQKVAFSMMNLMFESVVSEQTDKCKELAKELVPLIARLWPTKMMSANSDTNMLIYNLKDELLSSLLGMHLHLQSLISEDSDEDFVEEIRCLFEVLRSEYSNRHRGQLQLEDIDMTTLERTMTTIAPLSFIRLRPHNLRAEQNWMLLKVLGILDHLIHLKEYPLAGEANGEKHSRKRRRITKHTDDLMDTLRSGENSKRLTALQILPFTLHITQMSAEALTELLAHLATLMINNAGNTASWAMLGIVSCTTQEVVRCSSGLFDWTQIWLVGSRLVTSSNHSRAACLLLHVLLAKGLVNYHDIAEGINTIIASPELSGPTILADSTLSFMTHLLHIRNLEMPGASSVACQNVIRWVFTRWSPFDSTSGHLSTDMTSFTHPLDFINLLRACLSMPRLRLPTSKTTPCTLVGQAYQRLQASEGMIRYLLLLENDIPSHELCRVCPRSLEQHETENHADTNAHVHALLKIILELCLPKFETLAKHWKVSTENVAKQDSTTSISATIFAFLIGSHIVSLLGSADLRLLPELKHHVQRLAETAVSFTHGHGNESQVYDEVLLQEIQPYLPSCQSLGSGLRSVSEDSLFMEFVRLYAKELERRRSVIELLGHNSKADGDDDEDFDMRPTSDRLEAVTRDELSLASSPESFNSSTTMHVVLVNAFANSPTVSNSVPPTFLDHLLSLRDTETFLCRNLLQDILQSDLVFSDADAERLLMNYAEMISTNKYSKNEIVHGICLDILLGTVAAWKNDATDPENLSVQIYDWAIGCVKKSLLYSTGMIGLATLILLLMELHSSRPSLLSDLLKVLEHGDNRVKFYIAENLPKVFKLHSLIEHEGIFDQVVDVLPADGDCNEGIAFRMHVFALLASNWPTLLRRSTYHIWECPGRFPNCSNHATRCFSRVSNDLGLGGARELFRLFASQLLYTWLETDDIADVPFRTLDYGTLLELVQDTKVDITAIMMMRAQDHQVEDLSALLEVPVSTLLQQSFTKVMAYTTAQDISTPPADKSILKGEARVKGVLGQDEYLDLARKHFADIIAVFFTIVDQDEKLDKLFSRTDNSILIKAGNVMKEIKQLSSSDVTLPPNHQPAFKARYLGDEINFVCRRAQIDSSQIYTPTLVSFIARKLFDSIHPALGSLHTCAILRKLRLLICIAGSVSLQGSLLEMLLQSFRPYLSDPDCMEDTIGVVQYLLIHGSDHLSHSPSFVSGIALSTLASLRIVFKSPQPGAAKKTIISKAEESHQWLSDYFDRYKSPRLSATSQESFQDIVRTTRDIHVAGNAELDSPESRLLISLLEDESSSRPLLSRPARDLAFSFLCAEFKQPQSYREDICGSDEAAAKYAAVIWNLCRSGSVSKSFLAWGAKVIGRAFVANGRVYEELLRESQTVRVKELSTSKEKSQSSSSLLQLLEALTCTNDEGDVSLARSTLRFIISTLETYEDQDELHECQQHVSNLLWEASSWGVIEIPPSDISDYAIDQNLDPFSANAISCITWLENLSIKLCLSVTSDVVVSSLPHLLTKAKGFAEQAFPFILHSVLSDQLDQNLNIKNELSAAMRQWLTSEGVDSRANIKMLLNALLYLRTQRFPRETSHADRLKWLEIDYSDAARAALRCNMFKTALLFAEISSGTASSSATSKSSRRSLAVKNQIPTDLLLSIFRSIDEPDSFYGVQQDSSISSVLARLEYEKNGLKGLAFRGAQYDSNLRRRDTAAASDADSLVNILGIMQLDGLSHSLISAKDTVSISSESRDSMFRTARKLEQWDIPVPEASSTDSSTIYRAFQLINNAIDRRRITVAIDDGLRNGMTSLIGENLTARSLHTSLQSLSILTEMDEVLSSNSSGTFEEMLQRFENRASWMKTGRFDDISHIVSCRETLLSSLSNRQFLRDMLKVSIADTRLVEIRTILLSSALSRAHGALQESLASTTYMTGLIQPCHDIGLSIDAAVNLEAANSLWDLGEMTSSIGLLQELNKNSNLKAQTIVVGKSDLLAKLGYQVSTARLEMPDQIITKYLSPALAAVKEKKKEKESGQVYHEFASFCDQQLQDPDGVEDLERLRKQREQKQSDVEELRSMMRKEKSKPKAKQMGNKLREAEIWYGSDNAEYTRLSESRAGYLRQSLENYLLALISSDEYDKDALRFSAMWFENSDVQFANMAVKTHLDKVPSRKFVPLMNQLTSRLLAREELFQTELSKLVKRVCEDHPYHGMYQVWAASKSAVSHDELAMARQAAAKNVASDLGRSKISASAQIWTAINTTNLQYCHLAADDGTRTNKGEKYKTGQKVSMNQNPIGKKFATVVSSQKIPPSTMHIEIAANKDYSQLPNTMKVDPSMSIASGLSCPKIITLVADNGQKYKQLVKGGSDDLRQDAIMEQVFTQVSTILQGNRSTRQRNLNIRTYKIIPLSPSAGIIEFVPNSIALHGFLLPAHIRYHPGDISQNDCRNKISEAAKSSSAHRLKVFQDITSKFQPVMRYFFMEKFHHPDEWFGRRLAYTRSTAANSMVGHILGLGDRHGQNILLDEKTGEAVHIDFGFAFESGRVLPIPETVPFRLTRDIIDGMGITGTEGVFRRCCEFTLSALRDESYSIMTVLDVLRYDPLYSWSVNPVRLARLQNEQIVAPTKDDKEDDGDDGAKVGTGRSRAGIGTNEPTEAHRALTVVRKKLANTLSVEATVNDLINQATDEGNLSVLFQGWAAWV